MNGDKMTNPNDPNATPVEYPLNSLGWLAAQLKLDLEDAAPLVKSIWKNAPNDLNARTLIPGDKVGRLLGVKSERDTTLKLSAAAPSPQVEQPAPTGSNGEQESAGEISTERRLLTLSEIRGVAATTGATQKLVKSLDQACFEREQQLFALRGYSREQSLMEAEATGRLVARLQANANKNQELDEMELELAENASVTSDLAFQLFGVNLQNVINAQGEEEEERFAARQEMGENFEKFKQQEQLRQAAEASGQEYQVPEGERLGEDQLLDPWMRVKHELSKLEGKRTSKLRRGVTS